MVADEFDVYLSPLSSSFKIVPFPENKFFLNWCCPLSIQHCGTTTSIYNIVTPNDLKTDLTNDRAATWREIKHWKSRLVLSARFPVPTWHCAASTELLIRLRQQARYVVFVFAFLLPKVRSRGFLEPTIKSLVLFMTLTSQASTSFQCVSWLERPGKQERSVEP